MDHTELRSPLGYTLIRSLVGHTDLRSSVVHMELRSPMVHTVFRSPVGHTAEGAQWMDHFGPPKRLIRLNMNLSSGAQCGSHCV